MKHEGPCCESCLQDKSMASFDTPELYEICCCRALKLGYER